MPSYRPSQRWPDGPPPVPGDLRDTMYHFRGNTQDSPRRTGGHRPYRGGQHRRPGISQRPLLSRRQDSVERQIFRDPNAKEKFRNIDDLIDEDEEANAKSEANDHELPPTKRARLDSSRDASNDSTPKWSNPDPYTSLPPPTETTGKRTDVVKLIRKAKITESKKEEDDSASHGEDFISFDIDLDDIPPSPTAPPDAPAGPRSNFRGGGQNLGKRKRSREDADRWRLGRPYDYDGPQDTGVLYEWQANTWADPTPWLLSSNSNDQPGIALHKEIIDFYDWVKPKDYETEVRADVFERLSLAFNRIEPGELKAFGSYAAGLYLPTGDMDLVYMQRSFRPGHVGPNGLPLPPSRKMLEKFAKFLRTQEIAKPDSVLLIPKAKVPIIKFVERVSGLKVDLSFNNDTGIVANETFQKWKAQHPAMPILVSIVKQYLMIRGLNDVSIGGLGGFSIICLVTSLLQHMPMQGSPPNLGQLLVEFFNLYGNLLDKSTVAIRLDPPAYIDKASYRMHLFNNDKKNRLTIIDPNRPENNISGGTNEIDRIFSCFSAAHHTLHECLTSHQTTIRDKGRFSFLEDLVGGNFTAYEAQRKVLRDLYFGLTGTEAPAVIPPPPPPINSRPIPPPPPATSRRSKSGTANNDAKAALVPTAAASNGHIEPVANGTVVQPTKPLSETVSKGERRANRLKQARPELAGSIPKTISLADAVKLGGYESPNTMEHDLQAKENTASRTAV